MAARRNIAKDDRAIAGAVGIVLMLAVAVSAYAQNVRTNIPVYGEEAEHAWQENVAVAFRQLGRAIAESAKSGQAGAPTTTTIPSPPAPRSIDLPLLGSASPVPASGSVRFDPGCASASASHVLGDGSVIQDLSAVRTGCIVFTSATVYARDFTYTHELGGVLRHQEGKSVVVGGPSLELDMPSPSEYRVSIALAGLRGEATSASTAAADVQVDVYPGPSATESEQTPNAARATWSIETAHPGAWKDWFNARFRQAGFPATDYVVACDPVDCSSPGNVRVDIEGPSSGAAEDIKLSITYGLANVNVR